MSRPLSRNFERGRKRFLAGLSAGLLVVTSASEYLASRHLTALPAAAASRSDYRTYATDFPLAENPVSEGDKWVNGRAVGLDWANVRTAHGLAFGTESGRVKYDDSTALLAGGWRADQAVQATVYTVNQNEKVYEEVELRLRSSLAAHRATGYETNFRCLKTAKAYAQIVRWNGPLGDFTYLSTREGGQYGVTNGDVVKATAVGNVITAYINGTQVLRATDSTYPSGNPGLGFYLEGASGVNGDYGFTSFSAAEVVPDQAHLPFLIPEPRDFE